MKYQRTMPELIIIMFDDGLVLAMKKSAWGVVFRKNLIERVE